MVEQSIVAGWDDPRMPTLAGMRRRGYTPEAIVAFCERVGVSKRDSIVDLQLFEHMQREARRLRGRGSAAVTREAYLGDAISPGAVVGWIFNSEEDAYRIK